MKIYCTVASSFLAKHAQRGLTTKKTWQPIWPKKKIGLEVKGIGQSKMLLLESGEALRVEY